MQPGREAFRHHVVDGSYGEGGGQLVRTAVALSAMTGKPLYFINARANRPRPGLAPQHLAAVRAVAALCEARCEGLELRSTTFSFEPQSSAAGGELRVDVGTAGSVTLVLQALLPILIAAEGSSRVVLTGGTDVRHAPSWDYFREVLLRLLARMAVHVRSPVVRRGYYPRGGGKVVVEVDPHVPSPLVRQKPTGRVHISGEAHVAKLPISIAERMRDAALAALGARNSIHARTLGSNEAEGTGGAITVWAETDASVLGASRVAERGVRAEAIGAAVGAQLVADLASGAMLDAHAADQVLVYMAMGKNKSSFTARMISSHARTAMWLLPQFLPVQFVVEPDGPLWRVSSEPA